MIRDFGVNFRSSHLTGQIQRAEHGSLLKIIKNNWYKIICTIQFYQAGKYLFIAGRSTEYKLANPGYSR
jgi:hypothetical protein